MEAYMKAMKGILTSGAPAGKMLKSMERVMELRRIGREFSDAVGTLKDMLDGFQAQVDAGLGRIIEKLGEEAGNDAR